MASQNGEKVRQALLGKLEMFESRDGDHLRFRFDNNGPKDRRTKMSHSARNKPISSDLLARMAKQLGVSNAFFIAMVSCTKSRDDYLSAVGYIEESN